MVFAVFFLVILILASGFFFFVEKCFSLHGKSRFFHPHFAPWRRRPMIFFEGPKKKNAAASEPLTTPRFSERHRNFSEKKLHNSF